MQQVKGVDVAVERRRHRLCGFRSAHQQQSPALGAILQLGLGAVQEKFSQRLKRGITHLAHIFDPYSFRLDVDPEIAEHFPLMGEEAGVATLTCLERKEVVADDALQPLDAIIAGHPALAPMRQV